MNADGLVTGDDGLGLTSVKALRSVVAAIQARPTERSGTGRVDCPVCGLSLRYVFRRPGTIAAQCDTANCLAFRGQ